jgi:hypothetical protein
MIKMIVDELLVTDSDRAPEDGNHWYGNNWYGHQWYGHQWYGQVWS